MRKILTTTLLCASLAFACTQTTTQDNNTSTSSENTYKSKADELANIALESLMNYHVGKVQTDPASAADIFVHLEELSKLYDTYTLGSSK